MIFLIQVSVPTLLDMVLAGRAPLLIEQAFRLQLPFCQVAGPFAEWTLELICWSYAVCMVLFQEKKVFGHPQERACIDLQSDFRSIDTFGSPKVFACSLAPKLARGKRTADVTIPSYQNIGCQMASNIILTLCYPGPIHDETLLEYSQLQLHHLYLNITEFAG